MGFSETADGLRSVYNPALPHTREMGKDRNAMANRMRRIDTACHNNVPQNVSESVFLFQTLMPRFLFRNMMMTSGITDKRWLKMVSELEGASLPGLEIKAFRRDQKAEAEAWVSGSGDH